MSLFMGFVAGKIALDGIISHIERTSERYRDPLLQVEFTRR
jgi:hypothetical protein